MTNKPIKELDIDLDLLAKQLANMHLEYWDKDSSLTDSLFKLLVHIEVAIVNDGAIILRKSPTAIECK